MHADQFSQSMVSPFTGECLANGRDRAASRKERLGLNFATAEDFDAYVERGNRLWWAMNGYNFGTQGVAQGQPVTRPVVSVHWPAQLTQENNFSGYAHTRVGAGLAKPDTDAALAR